MPQELVLESPPSNQAPDVGAVAGRPPVFVLLLAFLLFFLRFGYDYGTSDQDEVIPFLLHRLDPGLFTQDWFVGTQAADFSVRTYYVLLLQGFSLFIPVWLTTLLVHIASWLLVAGAVYALAALVTRDRLAAGAAVLLALVLTPQWTLGGNELVHRMAVPSTLAWGLGLWAVYHFLRHRYLLAPVLLGVACWFQMLVGLHLAALLWLYRLTHLLHGDRRLHSAAGVLGFGVLFALWASPALGPLVYQQLTAVPPDPAATPSLFYILAAFRIPHHYLFFSFPAHTLLRFGLLAAVGLGLYAVPRFRRPLAHTDFIGRTLLLIAGFGVVAFLGTEVVPVLFIAKLQLFKMTVFAKLLFIMLVSGALVRWWPGPLRRPFEVLLTHRYKSLAGALALWAAVLVGVLQPEGPLRAQVAPFTRAETPTGAAEAWVRTHVPHDAVFAVPPSFSGFRTYAERTLVVNFKAIPYTDALLRSWFERLLAMAPIAALPERGGTAVLDDLDRAYEALTPAELRARRARYRFTHVLRTTPLPAPHEGFEAVYARDGRYIYHILPEGAAPA